MTQMKCHIMWHFIRVYTVCCEENNLQRMKHNFYLEFITYVTPQYIQFTRDVFYVRREVDLMKTAKVNAYIMHIFGKIELLYIYAT